MSETFDFIAFVESGSQSAAFAIINNGLCIDFTSVNRYNHVEKRVKHVIINDRLREQGITKYRLSKASGVPQATINDICSGKAEIEKCAAGTLYKISKVLGISIEDIIESAKTMYRPAFEVFKSNVCHMVKDLGDIGFIENMLKGDEITVLYKRSWYREAFYLLAMLDYLSDENEIPYCTRYDKLRAQKLETPVYPAGVITISRVMGSDEPLRIAEKNAIPQFRSFNIIENEVRNVI